MIAREIVEIILAATIPLAMIALIVERIMSNKGIGVRAIQFAATATALPVIVILSFEKILEGTAVAALIGTFVGYLFSHISEFDQQRSKSS